MEPLTVLATMTSNELASYARSALPDAPVVVADEHPPATARVRNWTATALRRAADAIASTDRLTAVNAHN
jgi:hypothetical protein